MTIAQRVQRSVRVRRRNPEGRLKSRAYSSVLDYPARAILLLCATILGLAAPTAAKSWRISNFHDDITVNRDGSASVDETISLVFVGEWHGIHRTIPIEYPGPNGTNYQLFTDLKSVTDENGSKLKYDSSTSGAYRDLKIYIPDAVDTTRTVKIVYRVRNGTRFFDQYDEFYWNVTGNDWPVPIDHAAATVRFPDDAAGSLRAQAFTGVYGSTEHDATAKVDGATAEFETTNPLPMRGGLTIDVYVPKGILTQPSSLTKLFWFIGGNPIVFLPLVTLPSCSAYGGTPDAIPIRACPSHRCTSLRQEFYPPKPEPCSTIASIPATLHRPLSILPSAASSRSKRPTRRGFCSTIRITSFIS